MSADHILYIPVKGALVLCVIYQSAYGFVHRLVGVSADECINALYTVYGATVDLILGLMLHPYHIVNLLASTVTAVPHTNIYESTLASIAIFNAKSQGNISPERSPCRLMFSIVAV